MSGVVYWLLWVLFNGLARLLFRFRAEGINHFPKTGGVIVAANHASYLDIPLLGCAIPRRVFFLGRDSLFPYRYLNWVIQKLGWIPLKTHRLDRKAFGRALSHLKAGEPVVIFPEGTRTEDGTLRLGKPGLGYLVAESQCQVIPAYISGTFKVLPVRARWPRPYPIRVTFGQPLKFCKDEDSSFKAFYEKVSVSVMDQIAQLGGVSSPTKEPSNETDSRANKSCNNGSHNLTR
ncbi:MAG: 1-acyl-sn-glycerol-3-phosphate acyltransferase [Nitrospirota bacterium]|nr:1-acyl-sn-glycerol-3-phosphate acyltransferase [Nitrospirota bacterium]MDH4361116.1 1-acyl-sn-glycerol-3-phosphate acyltransferase [Nitrospirota bacterium]